MAPRDPEVFIGLGDAWVAQRRFDRAVSWYKKALERAGTSEEKVRIHARMATAWERSGNPKKAVVELHRGVGDSQDPAAREGLAAKIDQLKSSSKER